MAQKEAKRLLRKQMSDVIKLINREQIREESAIVTEKVLCSDWFNAAKRVSIYVSTEGEIATDALIRSCLNDSTKKVFIPRFKRGADELEMLRLSSLEEFEGLDTTLWNIRQHSVTCDNGERAPISYDELDGDSSRGLDLMLVPGVAFTRLGERLGHGRGYYDKFFHRYKEQFGVFPVRVGLSLRCQLTDCVPTFPHDVKLDMVINADG